MKCVHCGYEHGWSGEKLEYVEGQEGKFFNLPIDFQRDYCSHEQLVETYACPSCKKIFIDF